MKQTIEAAKSVLRSRGPLGQVKIDPREVVRALGGNPEKIRARLKSGAKPSDFSTDQMVRRALWILRTNAKNPSLFVPCGKLLSILESGEVDLSEPEPTPEPEKTVVEDLVNELSGDVVGDPESPEDPPADPELVTEDHPSLVDIEPKDVDGELTKEWKSEPLDAIRGKIPSNVIDKLLAAGLETAEEIRSFEDLTSIKGIGETTRDKILKALDEAESATE